MQRYGDDGQSGGEIDEAGCLRIVGRLGEMIVLRNGEKLNAADVDVTLAALPGGREAVVFGFDGQPVWPTCPETISTWRAYRGRCPGTT